MAGIGLGGATVALMAIGGVLNQRGTWATTMVAIASFYVFIAIQTGNTLDIVVHTGMAAGFMALAIIGARTSSWMLASALIGHSTFDVFAGSVIANPRLDGGHRSVWASPWSWPSRLL